MEQIKHLQFWHNFFNEIFVSFQAKTYGNEFKKRKGVCTSFLDRLPVGGQFLSYHHANAMFKMPDDPNLWRINPQDRHSSTKTSYVRKRYFSPR